MVTGHAFDLRLLAGVDRVGVVDGDLHWTSTPALAIEKGKLAVAVCKRVALPPAVDRTKRELASVPTEGPAAANAARLDATGFLLIDAIRDRGRRVAAGVAVLVSLGGTAALVLGAILSVVWVCVEF